MKFELISNNQDFPSERERLLRDGFDGCTYLATDEFGEMGTATKSIADGAYYVKKFDREFDRKRKLGTRTR